KIGISQSALSTSIKKLEEDLGCRLFERSRGGISLTCEGRAVYEKLQSDGLRLKKEILGAIHQEGYLALKIGAASNFMSRSLLPILDRLKPQLPPLQIVNYRSLYLLEAVQGGRLDFAFITWSKRPTGVESLALRPEPTAIVGLRRKFAHIE